MSKQLAKITPLLLGAAAVFFYYGFVNDSAGYFDLSSDVLINALSALGLVLLVAIAWRPKSFIRPILLGASAAMLLNVSLKPLAAYGLVFLVGFVGEALPNMGGFPWFIGFALLSAVTAIAACWVFRLAGLISTVTVRTTGICALLCSFAAIPVFWDTPLTLAIHKSLWVALLGLGLFCGVESSAAQGAEIVDAHRETSNSPETNSTK